MFELGKHDADHNQPGARDPLEVEPPWQHGFVRFPLLPFEISGVMFAEYGHQRRPIAGVEEIPRRIALGQVLLETGGRTLDALRPVNRGEEGFFAFETRIKIRVVACSVSDLC